MRSALTKLRFFSSLITRCCPLFHLIKHSYTSIQEYFAIIDFVEKQGVDRKKFLEVFNSFSVQSKVARVAQMQALYNIESVPTIAIDGRYITSPSMVGANLRGQSEHALHAATLQVMDALIARKK